MKTIELILYSNATVEVSESEYNEIYSGMNPHELFGGTLDDQILDNMMITDCEEIIERKGD